MNRSVACLTLPTNARLQTVACALVLAMMGVGCSEADLNRLDTDAPLLLSFPILEREMMYDRVMGMDHDPDDYESINRGICANFEGESFPYCYDGHSGSDFDLIGGFEAMDAGSATVIAAAPGVVTRVIDGNYDRCRLDLSTFEPDCDGYPMIPNVIIITHANGYTTDYVHLMQDSAMVEVGQTVDRGALLGRVGSSGYSTAPHLHLGLETPDKMDVDPFAGPFSQKKSWWCEQDVGDGLPGDCSEE
ncbi:MAG: M23 family metallopeptidase [Myxococcota bacterium]